MKDHADTLTRKAYAKINLGLDVSRRLENGYHEVKMIMQTVGICDILTFTVAGSGIRITTDSGELPVNEDNLIYRAAALLMETCGVKEGIDIYLEKHIPIAAGMAGGSSDAAATLQGINELFTLGLSEEQLRQLGVRIGADVPYCIMGGTALAEGIGELLTPLPAAPRCHLLIARPDIQVSTRYVYEHLDARGTWPHPDIDGMQGAIRDGDLAGVVRRLGNVLETVTEEKYPVIGRLKEEMLSCGAMGSLMSGSGPTVFGIFDSRERAESARSHLHGLELAETLLVTQFV
ncbi:MAG: 4-(cytidine 5'-diphospho)-2-C-methyl-D-erythritol kinase [bacterium]|nr:4-(cytidine 5'-diphospho)-2-C-methyl-D-erythritol kinase [bacterium]MCM1373795.1 4-(cytidine 5'-diphospho)-2-C-methyl-D-erythritol kinase [Muribaculum sp.]